MPASRKKPPIIIKLYDSIPRNPLYPLQEFRVRVVKYANSENLLDIREYITSEKFTGYSPKGVTLTKEQAMYLFSLSLFILEAITNGKDKV